METKQRDNPLVGVGVARKRQHDRSSDPEPASKRQKRIGQLLPVVRQNDDILIADGAPPGHPDEIVFLTRDQYADTYDHRPNAGELDEKSVLIRVADGVYETRAQIFQNIRISPSVARGERRAERETIFAEKMDVLGLSSRHFGGHTLQNGYHDGPGGSRWHTKRFSHSLQAGEANPDMLIRLPDGSYRGVYPNLRPDMHPHGLDRIVERYGAANVWLKTEDHGYSTSQTMGPLNANEAFGRFTRQTSPYELPNLLLRRDERTYVGGATYALALDEAKRTSSNPQSRFFQTPEVLIRGRNGKALVRPSTLKWMGTESYKDERYFPRTVKRLGLPENVLDTWQENAPVLLGADPDSEGIFLSGEGFSARTGQRLAAMPAQKILAQNIGGRGGWTGNFAGLPHFLDDQNDKELSAEHTRQLGRPGSRWQTGYVPSDNARHELPPDTLSQDKDDEPSLEPSTDEGRVPSSSSRRGSPAENEGPSVTTPPVPLALAYVRVDKDYYDTQKVIARQPDTALTRKMLHGEPDNDVLFSAPGEHEVLRPGHLSEHMPDHFARRIEETGLPWRLEDQDATASTKPLALINTGDGRLLSPQSANVVRMLQGRSVIETFGNDRVLIHQDGDGYRTMTQTLRRGDAIEPDVAAAVGVEPRERMRDIDTHTSETKDDGSAISWSDSDHEDQGPQGLASGSAASTQARNFDERSRDSREQSLRL